MSNSKSKLNWLRAAVLGANDGIVSVSSIVLGVAGANASRSSIITAGIAGLTAGALSMAVGEYISVSSQKDVEREQMEVEEGELTNPWEAALASALSFFAGAIIPLLAVIFSSNHLRIPVTIGAVLIALIITGIISAKVSGAKVLKVTLRVVVGGMVAMAATYGIGRLFGTHTG